MATANAVAREILEDAAVSVSDFLLPPHADHLCLVLKHVREINTSPIYMAATGGCMSQKLGRNIRFFF